MLTLRYVLTLVVILVSGHGCEGQVGPCQGLNSCSCQYQDGTILDLSHLTRTDGLPAFVNVTDGDHQTYVSWNPCKPFSFNGTECEDVAVCVMREGIPNTLFYDVGKEDSARFSYNENGSLLLTYTSDKGDYKRSAQITLQCLQDAKFDFFVYEGEKDPSNDTVFYKMVLASRYACGYGPTINPAKKVSALNGGEIFAIVIVSLVGTYVIFGVAYQAIVKKESGKRLCPNHEFWCKIPACVSGACKNTKKRDMGANYDSI